MSAAPPLAFLHARQVLTMAGPARPRVGAELADVSLVEDGALLLRDGRVAACGGTAEIVRDHRLDGYLVLDLSGRDVLLMPGFVDCHTHPVFWGTREAEYELRIAGASYEEIAASGGGILNSARRVREASLEQLAGSLLGYCRHFLDHGTTTIEAKSGYGLSLDAELKLLRAIRLAAGRTALDLVPTFLGAHAYPPEYRSDHRGYLDALVHEMLPAVASEGLARFCDVFCDRGFFSIEEGREILTVAQALGLRPRLHADELSSFGGAELAAELGAVSADHLEQISPDGIQAMARAGVIAGLLPGTAFNLRLEHYPPARELIAAGVPVALATDFNPGTCFLPNMQLVVTIACTQLRMSPAEALVAATVNGAWALEQGHDRGTLEPGRRADVAVMAVADFRQLPYFFGVNHCVETVKDGRPLRALAFLSEFRRD